MFVCQPWINRGSCFFASPPQRSIRDNSATRGDLLRAIVIMEEKREGTRGWFKKEDGNFDWCLNFCWRRLSGLFVCLFGFYSDG